MKRTTLKFAFIFCLLLFAKNLIFAQNYVPFNVKFNNSLKGDILQIGNGIVNRNAPPTGPNVPFNSPGNNNSFNMQYIDIDGDPSTFSSSSANLSIPTATSNCYRIAYAALYWGGLYSQANIDNNTVNRANFNRVKLRLPGSSTYTNITGSIIYDAYPTILSLNQTGYVSVADVTSLLQALPDANGTYTVADLIAGNGAGSSGGWTLFIVYEDPLATAKNITAFDGFSAVRGTQTLNIPISGFTTIPVGPVRSKIAFAALEGDLGLTNDRFRVNGIDMSIPTRLTSNFFNSTINDINGAYNARIPNSTNLLGFDAGVFNVPNPGNTTIANGATSATLSLVTFGDAYFYYFNAFAIEVIQPQINLVKTVKDLAGNNIGNGNVTLGQELYYDLDFQNIGNDNAINFTLTDVLPVNVDYIPADLVVPAGVITSFDSATNTLSFSVPNSYVTQGGANYQIRIKVRVVDDCSALRDACSNEIRNQAFKTYSSQNSGNIVENQQPSVAGLSACLIPEPGTTNFLVGINDCTFERDEILCGNSVVLTAGSGYINYQWHNGSPPTAANAIPGATNQSYTATTTGVYSVVNTAPAPCLTIVERINVVDFNGVVPNPVIPYADEVAVCANDGSSLPKIFLCGAGDSQLIDTNILNAISIIWERLDEASCPPITVADCPNTNSSCTWTQVGTGPIYNATSAGQYRLRIVFQNGCFRTYYFNVFQNLFTPRETHTDIICNTNASITVNGVPAGYEYSISSATGPWQSSNVFSISTAGNYTVYIRQIGGGVGNCIFTIPNISIQQRIYNVNVIPTQPLCNGSLGSIRVQANGAEPQYTYQLFLGATLVNTAGPINTNDYTFPNLNAGTYTVVTTTSDGCSNTQNVTLTNPDPLTVTASVTNPITCNPGQITIFPVGGTPPYTYQVSTIPGFQSSPDFEIINPGNYTITVTDFNNCTATTTIEVNQIPPPVFAVAQTNILCYGNNTGNITFNVSNSNGYSLLYSIDNGVNFSSNPVFSNLTAGTYQTLVEYSLGSAVCTTLPQTINLTEPTAALTASGGVSQLAGCGPSGEGEVRITNPQGGVPPYQYSFDNGVTYGALNSAFLMPGTYTLYIRDTNLCVYPMVVTIDPAPNPPTIVVNSPDFNCNGTATSTVTVNNNGGSFAYTYFLDGVANTNVPNNVFVNVPCGDHVVTVGYQNLNIPTFSNLLNEDFGVGGNTTTPGIASAYCFNSQPYAPGRPCGNGGANATLPGSSCPNPSRTLEDNQYVVTSAINPNNCSWFPYRDHTSNGANPNGRFLAVNIGSAAGPFGILYSQPIANVLPNQPIIVELWLANLLNVGATGADPNFILELVDSSGNVVASQNTGIIDNTVNAWQLRTVTLNPGLNTNLTFNIRSGSILYRGNDAAIDDIRVYQLPISCITEVNFPINIACNQAFSASITSFSNASCNGASDGQVTIAAQNFELPYGFDYSLDNGVTWTNSTTSPVIVNGLSANTYNIQVRYDISGACSFPFTQVISQPFALVASATLTSPATCSEGAVITASASGATPNYQYQLQDNIGNIISPYQNSNIFSNVVPGDYIVVVRDSRGCTDALDSPINVPAPVNPIASISSLSDLCYDGSNAATIIVDTSSGVSPYQYSLNGGIFQNSNTFSGLVPGFYLITVRDAYNCSVTLPSVTIAPQLTASTTITNNLNCSVASPNATINVNITGGSSPFSYQVSFNGGPLSPSTGVIGNNFNYSAASSGSYQFTITDLTGCTFVTNTVIINPLPVSSPPTVTLTNPILCNGDGNASINVIPNGGLSPYVINVLNTTTGVNYGTQTTGLTAGSYLITVTDSNSCVETNTIVINQPDPITYTVLKTDIQCGASGTEPGSIDVTNVSGGTQPYTYIISNSFGYFDSYNTVTNEDHSFTILNFGVYTVTVVDDNGCQLVQNNIIISSPPNSLTIDISTPTASCLAGGTIEVAVNPVVTGGPYFFAIYQDLSPANPPYPTYPSAAYQAADVPGGLVSTFTGLIPGVTYSFIVYDQTTNCYYFETATGPVPTPSSITSSVIPSNVRCTGETNGSVSFTFQGYSGTSVSYQIYTALNNQPVGAIGTSSGLTGLSETVNGFGALTPGIYYILFTENDGPNVGCTQTSDNFTISESAVLLSLTATVTSNDNCNVDEGQITVIGSNGTAPYEYQLVVSGNTPPTFLTWSGQSSSVFNVEGGTYDVYIKDANNCIQSVSGVFVPTDSSPQISLSIDPSTTCNTVEGNYSIIVTRDNSFGVGPFTYSIDGGAFNTYAENAAFSFTLTGLNSGTHSVVVRDVNGCTDLQSITINAPLNGTAIASISSIPDCGVSDGIITVNTFGGSGSYNYSLSPSPIGVILTGNAFSNVPSGSYVVTITDFITGCSINIPVTISAPAPVNFNFVSTPTTCNGGADGSITINLTPGNTDPIYTYEITAPIVVPAQTSNVFNNLPSDTYTVVVRSARGCFLSQDIFVDQPLPINVPAPAVTQFNCNSGSNATNFATITVNSVLGGSNTYVNYEFIVSGNVVQIGSNNVYVSSDLSGGTYTVNVYDNNGCVGTTTATINPFISISDPTVSVVTPITCVSDEEITINVTISGGTPATLNYTVQGLGGNTYSVSQNSPNFSGLTVGNYLITVDNPTTGCSVQTLHYVFDPNTFDIDVDLVNNVTCFGGNNGSVSLTFIDNDVTPFDEAGAFDYIIRDSSGNLVSSGTTPDAGPFLINGLSSGIYSVEATLINPPTCTVNRNFTITQPSSPLTISISSTPISCVSTFDDGTISVTALDGWGAPYEYQLELGASVISSWSNTSSFNNLGPGNYTVSVRDLLGCVVSDNVLLVVPTPITGSLTSSTTNLACFGATNASITVNGVSGGFGSGYLYSLVNVTNGTTSAPQNSNVFNNLGAGTYYVIISDPLNCSSNSSNTIVITEPADNVVAQLNVSTTPSCTTSAIITLFASGGTAPYRYSATQGGPYTSFAGSVSFTAIPGSYQYFVIDANNCIEVVSNRLIVEPVIPVQVTIDTSSAIISCNGDTTQIVATATDGLGGYVYSLSPFTAGVVQSSPGVFENVPAGTYTVTVTSGDCTDTSDSVTINEPTPILFNSSSTNITCNGANDGSINVVATGGTGTIQYSISSNPLQTVNNGLFTNLAPGTYQVFVQDQAGCFLPPLSFTLTEPSQINLSSLSVNEEVCFNDGGSIDFSLTGGTTTATVGYTVSVNNGFITQSSLTGNFSFTNLLPGTYDFLVTDANGCDDFQFTQILDPGVDIQAIPDVSYACLGNLPSNEVVVDVNPLVPLSEFTFSLDGGPAVSSNIFTNVAAGNHNITVTHISGCNETVPFFITSYTSPVLTLAQSGLNQFTATTVGGAGGNEYLLNGDDVGTTTVYFINQTGNYTVTVIDDNGCEDTETIFMTFYDVSIPDFFTPDGDGNNDTWSPIYTDNFPDLEVYIFDRYSRKIKTLRQGDSWDGNYNNNPLPTGDYWYVLKLNGNNDTREFVGNFTLYR